MMLRQNPQIANNPRAQEIINILQTNDNERGAQLAQNLCNSYNINPTQAVQQAQQFFGINPNMIGPNTINNGPKF